MIEVIDREDALVRACNAINTAKVTMNWRDADITPDAYLKLARSFATALTDLQSEMIIKNWEPVPMPPIGNLKEL